MPKSKKKKKKAEEQLTYRQVAVVVADSIDAQAAPETFDRDQRTVQWTLASENPVMVYDFKRWEVVPEVLLMSGLSGPPKKIPYLDAHSRLTVSKMLGSVREIAIDNTLLVGTVHFSKVQVGEDAMTLVEEGHLEDGSIGYRVHDSIWIGEGEKGLVAGKAYEGPVSVVTSWSLREFSAAPIGADEISKARSAHANIPPDEEKTLMNKKLRAYLESTHSLRAEATDTEARDLFRSLDSKAQDAALDHATATGDGGGADDDDDEGKRTAPPAMSQAEADRIREEARAGLDSEATRIREEERARVEGIRSACSTFDLPVGFANSLVDNSTTLDNARAAIFERAKALKSAGVGIGGGAIVITSDARDSFRSACTEGLMIRAGLTPIADVQHGGRDFAAHSLREMATECLRIAGQPHSGIVDKLELFQRALSTSDFPNILGDVANRAMLAGFEDEEESFGDWVDTTGVLSDFRNLEMSRASEFPALLEVNPDGGEYKMAKRGDKKEVVAALDFGRIIAFTRKLMVNDDLGALTDTAEKMGRAARRKQGDLVYVILTGNPNMGDGTDLFDSDHNNLAGSGAAPSNTTLNAGMAAMATQKDILNDQVLNVRAKYIIGPVILFATIQSLLKETTPNKASDVNLFTFLTPVYDARLDTASSTVWYLAGRKGLTIKLFSMDGVLTPAIDQRMGFEVDGMEIKVRWSGAAKALDWAGLYKNPGA